MTVKTTKVNEVWCQDCETRIGFWRPNKDPEKAKRAARDHARYRTHTVRVDLSIYYSDPPF